MHTEEESLIQSADRVGLSPWGWATPYQTSGPIKFKKNNGCIIALIVLYYANFAYILLLEALALNEFAQISPNNISNVIQNQSNSALIVAFLGTHTWSALISIQVFFATAWWISTIAIASLNASDVINKRAELMCPPTIFTVAGATLNFLLWLVVLASTITIYELDSSSNVTQSAAFMVQMLLVLLIGIGTTIMPTFKLARATCDSCLLCCDSPCRDC